MDYQKHYNKLIERAGARVLETYTERHHIVPKCVGGSNARENLVDLTPEEHFVAHQLLVKIYPESKKLVYAANMMCVGRNNKSYGWIRKRIAEALTNRTVLETTKQKLSLLAKQRIQRDGHPRGMLGKKHTKQTKEQMVLSRTGANNGMYGKKHSQEAIGKMKSHEKTQEHRDKIAKIKTGKKNEHTQEWRVKVSQSHLNSLPIMCPHCGTQGKKSPMYRWHFDNCRSYK